MSCRLYYLVRVLGVTDLLGRISTNNTIMIKPSVERPSRNLHIDAFRTSLPGKWFVFLCTLCMFGGDYCHGHSEKEKKIH